jgi:DNA-binding NarL/FixJ family response regulator
VAPIRVLIADDHRLFAKTLEAVLAGEPDLELVGIAADGVEALHLASTLRPDIVLMDVDMPRLDGISATRRLHELQLGAAVLILTASLEPEDSAAALEAGAAGYLTKDRVAQALVQTIRGLAERRDTLSADGGADVAGRARVG